MNYVKRIKLLKPYVMAYDKDTGLGALEHETRHLCWIYNHTDPNDQKRRQRLVTKIFRTHARVGINEPFHCDYGFNVRFKGTAFFNYDDVLLDSSPIIVGDGVTVAPHVCISCVGHPLDYRQRRRGMSVSSPVILGNDVWIGANSFVRGGVKIGDHSVIGAGSVVTHSIPSDVVAFGSPCKVYRKITKNDVINGNNII